MGRRPPIPGPGVNADVEVLSLAELAGKAGKTGGLIPGVLLKCAGRGGEFLSQLNRCES